MLDGIKLHLWVTCEKKKEKMWKYNLRNTIQIFCIGFVSAGVFLWVRLSGQLVRKWRHILILSVTGHPQQYGTEPGGDVKAMTSAKAPATPCKCCSMKSSSSIPSCMWAAHHIDHYLKKKEKKKVFYPFSDSQSWRGRWMTNWRCCTKKDVQSLTMWIYKQTSMMRLEHYGNTFMDFRHPYCDLYVSSCFLKVNICFFVCFFYTLDSLS